MRSPTRKTGRAKTKRSGPDRFPDCSSRVWQVQESTITSTGTSKSKISSFSSGYAGISYLLSFWGSWREATGALNGRGGGGLQMITPILLSSQLAAIRKGPRGLGCRHGMELVVSPHVNLDKSSQV